MKVKVAIIGGGISGLSAAWELERRLSALGHGWAVDVFESSVRLGGKLHTRSIELAEQGKLRLELGAESFLSRKPHGMQLCRELGIEPQLVGTRPETRKTFVWHRDRLHPLPAGLSGFVPSRLKSLRSTTLLSPLGKLRVVMDYLLPARWGEADESLASFISRRIGDQAYRRLAQPLLCGIYSSDGSQLSLAATYPELRELELKYGSLLRGLHARQPVTANGQRPQSPFVTFPDGMQHLIGQLGEKLVRTRIRLQHTIQRIERSGGQWKLAYRCPPPAEAPKSDFTLATDAAPAIDGREEHQRSYDAVLVTTSAHAAAPWLRPIDEVLSQHLSEIPHVSTATVNLWYDAATFDHPLDGYGFVIPTSEQRGVTAVTWTSSKHFGRAPQGIKLIRGYVGRAGDELDLSWSDERVAGQVQSELTRTMGLRAEPRGWVVQRWPHGSPQYVLGHLERLRAIEDRLRDLPGLLLCGSSYRGVGIPDCIRDSRATAERLVEYLQRLSA